MCSNDLPSIGKRFHDRNWAVITYILVAVMFPGSVRPIDFNAFQLLLAINMESLIIHNSNNEGNLRSQW